MFRAHVFFFLGFVVFGGSTSLFLWLAGIFYSDSLTCACGWRLSHNFCSDEDSGVSGVTGDKRKRKKSEPLPPNESSVMRHGYGLFFITGETH